MLPQLCRDKTQFVPAHGLGNVVRNMSQTFIRSLAFLQKLHFFLENLRVTLCCWRLALS